MKRQFKRTETISNTEIVAIAVYMLGGKIRSIDTEDVAVKAHSIAPNRFSWKKYKDQISMDAVRKRLWDATKRAGFLSGSEAEGWMLTQEGLVLAEKKAQTLTPTQLAGNAMSKREERWHSRERTRMLTTDAFQKHEAGRENTITSREAEAFFRIDDYITGQARQRKLVRLLNSFSHDPILGPAVVAIAKHVHRRDPNDQ